MKSKLLLITLIVALIAVALIAAAPRPPRFLTSAACETVTLAGSGYLNLGNAGSVNFPARFDSKPIVVVTPLVYDGSTPSFEKFWLKSSSISGFAVEFDNAAFLDGFNWVAVGQLCQ